MPSLDQLKVSESARITSIQGTCRFTTRLMEMGLLEGEEVQMIGRAPFGDPMTFLVRGSRMALRAVDARRVAIDVIAVPRSAIPV